MPACGRCPGGHQAGSDGWADAFGNDAVDRWAKTGVLMREIDWEALAEMLQHAAVARTAHLLCTPMALGALHTRALRRCGDSRGGSHWCVCALRLRQQLEPRDMPPPPVVRQRRTLSTTRVRRRPEHGRIP